MEAGSVRCLSLPSKAETPGEFALPCSEQQAHFFDFEAATLVYRVHDTFFLTSSTLHTKLLALKP